MALEKDPEHLLVRESDYDKVLYCANVEKSI